MWLVHKWTPPVSKSDSFQIKISHKQMKNKHLVNGI